MKRILLIIPPAIPRPDRDTSFKEFLPHIGLSYVAGSLDAAGCTLSVIDAPAENRTLDHVVQIARNFRPDAVGITSNTYQIADAVETAERLKKESPDLPVVLGGYHASALPERTLREYGCFDYVVFGEGEHVLPELLDALWGGNRTPEIRGLAYRTGEEITAHKPTVRIQDLDRLPFPAFQHFPLKEYRGFYRALGRGVRPLTICTTRGCPHQCNFCFKSVGSVFRKRSAGNVLEEIQRDIHRFRATQLVFTDENFLLNRNHALEVCEGILQEGFHRKMEWICEARVDCVDPELLRKMAEAHCVVLSYGIEAGNQEILDKVSKAFTLEQARNAIRWTRQAGIYADTSFIIGHTYETRETIRDTIRFSIELDPDSASFAILSPFPGTRVAEMARRGEGGLRLLTEDWTQYGKQIGAALELKSIPRADLETYQRWAYIRFFMRPSKIRNFFKVVNLRSLPVYLVHTLRLALRSRISAKTPSCR